MKQSTINILEQFGLGMLDGTPIQMYDPGDLIGQYKRLSHSRVQLRTQEQEHKYNLIERELRRRGYNPHEFDVWNGY